MREKRKFRRWKADLPANYTKVEGCVTMNSSSVIKDISLGGLCASLSKIVKKGDELLVEVTSQRGKKIATLAKVVWMDRINKGTGNMCGLKFLWISSKSMLNDSIAVLGDASTI